MKFWNTITFSQLFPGLILWFRLPALISWAGVSMGVALFFQLPANLFQNFFFTPLFYTISLIIATILIITAIIIKCSSIRFFLFFMVSLIVCIHRRHEQLQILSLINSNNKKESIVTGTVISFPAQQNKGYKFLLKCKSATFDKDGLLTGKTILCKSYITPLSIGDIKIFGKCENAVIKQNRFDYNEYLDLMSNGIWGKFTVDSLIIAENISFFHKIEAAFREQVLLVLDKIKNKDHKSILRAAFLNEKEYLSSEIKLAFRKSGIYHLLAISGLHAGMLIAATYLFLTLLPIPSNHKHCIALIILWLYQLFIGFIPSLFRATIMATFIITTLIFQKKNYALQSIGLAGTIWLLHSPESLFLPGYQLSFAATYGIIVLSNVFNELVPKTQSSAINFLLSKVISIFSVSLSGFLSTAPVLIYHFGTLSMFGLVANLIAVSLMGYCMWTFFISLLFISFLPLVSETAIRFSSVALDLLIKIADSVKFAPWSELVLYVPHFEVLLIYLLTLCGIATIKKKYTITYLKLAVPIFLILVPLCILLREIKNNQIKTETFKGKNTKITAVLWPHNGIWLFCEGKEPQVSLTISNSVKSWVRHQPNAFLEKSFLINPAFPNTLIEKNKTDLFKLCPIGAAGSKLKRTDNLNESAEAHSIQFRNTYTCEIKKDKYLIILIRDGEQSIQINLGEPLFIEGKIK